MSSATLKIDIPEDGPPVTNTGGSGNQKIHANLCRQPRNKATIVAGAFRVANKFCRIIYIYSSQRSKGWRSTGTTQADFSRFESTRD